jgi:hypothetical protein
MPGNPAAVSRIMRDLGQWLCVPPFRVVCLFQAFKSGHKNSLMAFLSKLNASHSLNPDLFNMLIMLIKIKVRSSLKFQKLLFYEHCCNLDYEFVIGRDTAWRRGKIRRSAGNEVNATNQQRPEILLLPR